MYLKQNCFAYKYYFDSTILATVTILSLLSHIYEKYVRFYATICFYFVFICTKCGENLFAKVETFFAHDEDLRENGSYKIVYSKKHSKPRLFCPSRKLDWRINTRKCYILVKQKYE